MVALPFPSSQNQCVVKSDHVGAVGLLNPCLATLAAATLRVELPKLANKNMDAQYIPNRMGYVKNALILRRHMWKDSGAECCNVCNLH